MDASALPSPPRPEQRHRGGQERPLDSQQLSLAWRSEAFGEDLPVPARADQPHEAHAQGLRAISPWLTAFVAAAWLPWGR